VCHHIISLVLYWCKVRSMLDYVSGWRDSYQLQSCTIFNLIFDMCKFIDWFSFKRTILFIVKYDSSFELWLFVWFIFKWLYNDNSFELWLSETTMKAWMYYFQLRWIFFMLDENIYIEKVSHYLELWRKIRVLQDALVKSTLNLYLVFSLSYSCLKVLCNVIKYLFWKMQNKIQIY
jgi:hypothetical protein